MMSMALQGAYKGKVYDDPGAAVSSLQSELKHFADVVLPNAGRRAMERYLKQIATKLAAKHSRPYPSGTGQSSLSSRSGKGAQSIRNSVRVEQNLDTVLGYIGGEWYLKTQEFSATIRARHSKYLTIPLPAALNSNGTPKKMNARQWSNTFVRKSKKGNLLIFQQQGDKIVPLYVLKKSVFIPARLGMRKELTRNPNIFFSYLLQDIQSEFKA